MTDEKVRLRYISFQCSYMPLLTITAPVGGGCLVTKKAFCFCTICLLVHCTYVHFPLHIFINGFMIGKENFVNEEDPREQVISLLTVCLVRVLLGQKFSV